MLGIRRCHQWQDQQCCPHCQSVVIKPALLSRQGFVLCFTSAVYLPSLWLLGDSKGVHGEMEEQWVCWYTEAGSCEERAHTHTHVSLWKRCNGTDLKSSTQCSVHTIAPCSAHCHQSSVLQQLSTETSLVSIFVHYKECYTQFWFSRHFYSVFLFGVWHHRVPIYSVSLFKVLVVANSQQMSKYLASPSYSTMQGSHVLHGFTRYVKAAIMSFFFF